MRKSRYLDFIYTFLIFAGIFICLALITSTDIFNEAVKSDGNTVSFFGADFIIDTDALHTADKIFRFNDNIFGDGFSGIIQGIGAVIFGYVCELFTIFLSCAKMAVGA